MREGTAQKEAKRQIPESMLAGITVQFGIQPASVNLAERILLVEQSTAQTYHRSEMVATIADPAESQVNGVTNGIHELHRTQFSMAQ